MNLNGNKKTPKTQKNAEIFNCKFCDFKCCKNIEFDRHLTTPKHQKTEKWYQMVTNGNTQKNTEKFNCNLCDFKCCKKSDFDRHKMTPKHKNAEKTPKIIKPFMCSCGKEYLYNSGLSRHKKICELVKKQQTETISEKTDDNAEMIRVLIRENNELKTMMMEVCQKIQPVNNTIHYNTINSNNKTFNLNVFLNETCKDAMNITDFIDSLKFQLSDLESVGKLGYVNGISNIIVKNLNSLDETMRPIHCTDIKREVLYIKDKNKWEKDDESNHKIKGVIKKVTDKNTRLLPKFKKEHPDYIESSSKYSDQYNKIIVESFGGDGDNDDEKEIKIIKNILKGVSIDKKRGEMCIM